MVGEAMTAFIKLTKTTEQHGLREYYIDAEQIAMVNTGQLAEPEPGQPAYEDVRQDEGVVWLKGTQVFIACDQTPEEIMALVLSTHDDPQVFDMDDFRRALND